MLQYKVSRFRALVTAVALTAGCDRSGLMVSPSQRVGPELTASSAFPGFVTDPAPPTTDAGIGLAESGAPDVVYVSMTPGVSPNGLSATISNYRTNRSVSTPMVDGGFDPVRLGARAADTILVTFQLSGGATKLTWKVVPSAQRPFV